MKLNPEQFSRGVYNYRTEANGLVYHAPRFSYESLNKLYDVIQMPQGTAYRTNGGPATPVPSPIHLEILKHFVEQHMEWRYKG